MLENYVNDGAIWKKFMGLNEIKRWIEKCSLAKENKAVETPSAGPVIPVS